MPVFQVHYRTNVDGQEPVAKLQLTGLGVVVQRLILRGYTIHFDKPDLIGGGGGPFTNDQFELPQFILIDIDELESREIITAETQKTTGGYTHHNNIILPVEGYNTTKFGLDLSFDVNKKLNREFNIAIKKYDETGRIIAVETDQLDPIPGPPLITGRVAINNIVLYFDYEWVSFS